MSESKKVWQKIKKKVPGYWLRIEVANLFGIPDCLVLQQDGRVAWIELKYLRSWPKRKTTRTDLGVRPAQANFMKGWCEKGGRGYLLVRVANEFLLVPGHKLDKMTRDRWYEVATGSWLGEMDYKALGEIM